jgi:hypothetical protein
MKQKGNYAYQIQLVGLYPTLSSGLPKTSEDYRTMNYNYPNTDEDFRSA